MAQNPVAHFFGQVQAPALVFELLHHTHALLIMPKAVLAKLVEHPLARVAERGMSQIVPERDRFGQIFIEQQSARDGSCDLRNLERVGQPGTVVVAFGRQKHLCFVL